MTGTLAHWMLEQEARGLLTRLDRVRPFVLQETMVPAASLAPAAQAAIEGYLLVGRGRLRAEILRYLRWLRGPGLGADPTECQRRFTFLRLRFNSALGQMDLFGDAITQRSEHETGVWLSGLDVAATDALTLPGSFFQCPPIVCYLHRGLGGAIRRARTRLPGGGENPVAIVRIPRERMIGYGIASSLVHEVGHQAAALLGLVESLRPALQHAQRNADPVQRPAWAIWERTVSETIADFWSIGKVGISSTLGLIGIVSLPRAFVFRINMDDPHPFPWIRVQLSCAIGDALYPHPQWRSVAAVFRSFYPMAGLERRAAELVALLLATIRPFVRLLVEHRPPSLRGRSLGEVVPVPERTPDRLIRAYRSWHEAPEAMRNASPCLAFAALGQARASGLMTPEQESRALGRLITHWAVKSTLELTTRPALGAGLRPGGALVPSRTRLNGCHSAAKSAAPSRHLRRR
jgi:hypothetical protein